MKKTETFPFERARHITTAEHRMLRRAYKNTFGKYPPRRRRGRPPKRMADKYRDIHLKIHPKALEWVKMKAKQEGIGYQTVINEVLMSHAA